MKIPAPPPFQRRIWHYNRANVQAIRRSLINFPWAQHLSLNYNTNWQVKTFTDIVLNVMSNFVPNEMKKTISRDPPWITKDLKLMLNKKTRLFHNYKKHGYRIVDKVRPDGFRENVSSL